MRLKYIGNGQYLRDVPARSLTLDEVNEMGLSAEGLIASGLYVEEGEEEKADEVNKRNNKRDTEHNQ